MPFPYLFRSFVVSILLIVSTNAAIYIKTNGKIADNAHVKTDYVFQLGKVLYQF